jgi:hypothetical protein
MSEVVITLEQTNLQNSINQDYICNKYFNYFIDKFINRKILIILQLFGLCFFTISMIIIILHAYGSL